MLRSFIQTLFPLLLWLAVIPAAQANSIELTAQEKAFLEAQPKIRLGIDKSWSPYIVINEDGSLSGHDHELLSKINAISGANFVLVPGDWEDLIELARQGKIDGLSAGGIHEERKQYLNFSDIYFTIRKMVIVQKGNPRSILQEEDLANKTIAIHKSNLVDRKIAERFESSSILLVNSPEKAIEAILSGAADATFGNGATQFIASEMGMPYLEMVYPLGEPLELAFGIRKDWPEAISIINKSLSVISRIEKAQLRNKWFIGNNEVNDPSILDHLDTEMILKALAVLAIIIYIAFLAIRYHSMKLEKEALEARSLATQARFEAKTKSDFLSRMSHEIRTPLQTIIMAGERLGSLSPDEKQRKYLAIQSDAARYLLDIINKILDYNKIEANAFKSTVDVFDIVITLTTLKDRFETFALHKKLSLTLDTDEGIPKLMGDELAISQIIANLLDNAIRFTSSGTITMRCTVHDKSQDNITLQISISDSGPGITQQQLKRLFKPFSQADESISRKYGGTGLGLSISKKLADLLKGQLEVNSTIGRGSTFRLTVPFPIAKNSESPTKHKPDSDGPSPDPSKPLPILIIDDNKTNLQLIGDIVKHLGFDMTMADNGRSALEVIHRNRFNLILLDIEMPDLSGLETCALIREQEDYLEVPVIAMTAHVNEGLPEEYAVAGFDDILVKPFTSDQLLEKIQAWPDNRKPAVLDIEQGLANMADSASIYKNSLVNFSSEYRRSPAIWNEMFQNNRLPELQKEIHKTKSASGFICADRLTRQLKEAEIKITQGSIASSDIELLAAEHSILCRRIDAALKNMA